MDREKVIKGLECAIKGYSRKARNVCDDCPYDNDFNCLGCVIVMRDALELLKEQEEQEKRILSIVWDVLHGGVATDTKADQDFVYELVLEKVENYDKDVNRNG